ncbi:MAG TPA: hypothetical protein VGZ01_11050 [Trinickia sp.]|nr:hypothetical protein [Trinickia sp.]
MDRRSFMKIGASVVAGGLLPPMLIAARGNGTRGEAPPIVLVDTALAESRAYAELAAARDSAHVVDIDGDVGALWHAMLGRVSATLVGALRASDFFVLRHLAVGEGRIVSHTNGERTITFRIHADVTVDARATS